MLRHCLVNKHLLTKSHLLVAQAAVKKPVTTMLVRPTRAFTTGDKPPPVEQEAAPEQEPVKVEEPVEEV